MALHLQKLEGGNYEVIALASLLHDISDHKYNGGKEDAGGKVANKLLLDLGSSNELAASVSKIIDQVSFKGAKVLDVTTSLEAKIVQDADRLDAIGAIGIARAFAYGGSKSRPLFEPNNQPELHETFQAYRNAKSHTINHFYEKLLLLCDRLHTAEARRIGKQRHDFMLNYLQQFYNEWEFGKLEKNDFATGN
jgi:uncharacterized protein